MSFFVVFQVADEFCVTCYHSVLLLASNFKTKDLKVTIDKSGRARRADEGKRAKTRERTKMRTGERETADEGEGKTCKKFRMGKREGAADEDACGGGEGRRGQGRGCTQTRGRARMGEGEDVRGREGGKGRTMRAGEGDGRQGWPRASTDVVPIGASRPWDRRRGVVGVGCHARGVEGVHAFDIAPVGGFLAIEFLGEMGEG
ncbi:hypothetical protein HD554DRAFT_2327677 [Boletus coccyginus]|nr:hypothetical protein HD554DRAFT_2327677 [Boletus coccyginus]